MNGLPPCTLIPPTGRADGALLWLLQQCFPRQPVEGKPRDDSIPCIIESDAASPTKRKAWARLIRKIYGVDPLTCPQCRGAMKIISFIDQPEVVMLPAYKAGHPGA